MAKLSNYICHEDGEYERQKAGFIRGTLRRVLSYILNFEYQLKELKLTY